MKNKKIDLYKVISVFVLMFTTATASVFLGYFIGLENREEKTVASKTTLSKDQQEIIDTYNYIVDNYYENVDTSILAKGAIEGMVNSLGDDFSSYLDEDANENFMLQIQGTYTGVGVSMTDVEGKIVVTGIFEGSPAEKAGIKIGDIIIAVDGVDFTEKVSQDIVDTIRKGEDKTYELTLLREEKEIKVSVKKAVVTIKSVDSKIYEENGKKIGYIYVSVFAQNTASQFNSALKELENQKIDSLIIDLRDNTGGYLSAAKSMISQFLSKDEIIYKTETKDQKETIYSTGSITKTYPIVMLANANSASASEIMIAALKESYGAKLVGTTTFGKGTVQELVDIDTTDSYKFTIKKWLTPNGTWINKVGIEPDYKEELNEKYFTSYDEKDDNQLQKALELLK